MLYRQAKEQDIDSICMLIKDAIINMEKHNIFQWDNLYPNKEDFMEDIRKGELYVGLLDDDIVVVYTINTECDAEYQKGDWKYWDCEYRVLHRLCVNPNYQNRGIAKSTLMYIEEKLQKMKITSIRLDVYSNNPFALELYSNSGYEKVGFVDWQKGRFYLMEKYIK